jgi:hypothetical protein
LTKQHMHKKIILNETSFLCSPTTTSSQNHKHLTYYLSRAMQTLIMFYQPIHQPCEIKIMKNAIRLTKSCQKEIYT